jgi:hypothetical protein
MNHVVDQRMGKLRPMCWTTEGAHLLVQVRCAVLDGRLDALFHEWYPRFRFKSMAFRGPALRQRTPTFDTGPDNRPARSTLPGSIA